MKYTIDNLSKVFKPVTVSLTFETQRELDTIGRLFNNGVVETAIVKESGGDIKGYSMYKIFEKAGANITPSLDLK